MTASEVLAEILRIHPEIESLLFHTYIPHLNKKELNKNHHFDLWELLWHTPPQQLLKLKRNEIAPENLNRFISSVGKHKVLAIMSEVKIKEDFFHIPMMDFDCQEKPENMEKIEEFLYRYAWKPGVILSSGRSYHYYGAVLIPEKEQFRFLGRCILFTGYTDERYIGHRLIDGHGTLRITGTETGIRPKTPTVVSVL